MVNPQDDFLAIKADDPRLNAIIDGIMDNKVGKDRKSVLTQEQALQITRARAYADSFAVYEEQLDPETEEMIKVEIEPPLMLIHDICDYLENTAVSVSGKGLKQLVSVLTARLMEQDQNAELSKQLGKVVG